nr:MAG TPA: hypothetical protein [Caudoviricetes sp.]
MISTPSSPPYQQNRTLFLNYIIVLSRNSFNEN